MKKIITKWAPVRIQCGNKRAWYNRLRFSWYFCDRIPDNETELEATCKVKNIVNWDGTGRKARNRMMCLASHLQFKSWLQRELIKEMAQ